MLQNKENIDINIDILVQFGKNLRKVRLAKGLSQEKLALENDFNRTYVSLLERGQRNPSLKTMYKLAIFLGIDVKELLEGI